MQNSVLGGYKPLITPLHHLDARIKIVALILLSTSIFFVHSWAGLTLFVLMAALCVQLSHFSPYDIVRGLKPTAFILICMLIAHGFSFSASHAFIGSFGFDQQGLIRGLFYVVRIVLLVLFTLIVTFTTSLNQLTDALGWCLGFLRPLKVPVDDITTMLSIALRFIPTTSEEFQRVMMAQQARGAQFHSGSIFKRIKTWSAVLIPLFVNLFKRSFDLAHALDSRCYTGKNRTRLSMHKLAFKEIAIPLGIVGLVVVGGVLL